MKVIYMYKGEDWDIQDFSTLRNNLKRISVPEYDIGKIEDFLEADGFFAGAIGLYWGTIVCLDKFFNTLSSYSRE